MKLPFAKRGQTALHKGKSGLVSRAFNQTASKPLIFIGALMAAVAYAILAFTSLENDNEAKREILLRMTSSFVDTFSETRGTDAEVPASFRRMALDDFSANTEASSLTATTMRMPGLPGHEIATRETNRHVAGIISGFDQADVPRRTVETVIEEGRVIGRTIEPSIATTESCTACHNSISNTREWQVGDVMGAFVVESDLDYGIRVIALQAFVVFALSFLALGVFARRESRRMKQAITSLEKEVQAERLRREAEEKLHFLAKHDALTGLPNRSSFMDRIEGLLQTTSPITLALVDLDGFKAINDTHGHSAGDAILKVVATRFESEIRKRGGFVTRLGGDELAAVLKDNGTIRSARRLGETLVEKIRQPLEHEGITLLPQASIGLARTADVPDRSADTLIKLADHAMYQAKQDGKGVYRLYDAEIARRVAHRRELAIALPSAIENGEISVRYQPQIDLSTGTTIGFEALARWERNGSVLQPIEFIEVAEESGTIRDLDLFVLREAALQLANWLNLGLVEDLTISSNLSARHFDNDQLAENVARILRETGVPPSKIVLEFTESVLISNWKDVTRTLSELRALGVRTALDDFGTGYSSLSYLRKIDVDQIKIDRSFIVDIATSQETLFVFDNIADIVIGLGKQLVIEGIETEPQLGIVTSHGGHVGQGFLFGEPLNPAEAEQRMREEGGSTAFAV